MSRSAIDATARAYLAALRVPRLPLIIEFPGLDVRFTNWPKDVSIGGKTYTGAAKAYRRQIGAEGFSENLDFEAPTAVLRFSGKTGPIPGLFNGDSFRGEAVTISILYLNSSGTLTATGWTTSFVCDADVMDDVVTLRLASSDVVEGAETPNRTTQEWGCQADYRGEGCGYRGTLATCDKGYDTPNGCKEHWPNIVDPQTGTRIPQWKPYGGFLGNVDAQLVFIKGRR